MVVNWIMKLARVPPVVISNIDSCLTLLLFKNIQLTMQIALTPHLQTPPRMLRHGMNHMVQKPNARINLYSLTFASLCRMRLCLPITLQLVPELAGLKRFKCPAIDVERELDLGLVGVAINGRAAGAVLRHCVVFGKGVLSVMRGN